MPERLTSPATARNREPILTVLQRILPADARVLELASGAGEHAIFFANAMPGLTWRPSDADADARASIAAWIKAGAVANVLAPVAIDACDEDWGLARPLRCAGGDQHGHISPWPATLGLMAGARALLREGGVLFTYGPYMRDGRHTAPSNQAFDASLKARDPRWGVRDVADVTSAARAHGLILRELVEMPANNLSLVFEKRRSIA